MEGISFLQPTKESGSVVRSPSGVRGTAPVKNEFGAFYASQKTFDCKMS